MAKIVFVIEDFFLRDGGQTHNLFTGTKVEVTREVLPLPELCEIRYQEKNYLILKRYVDVANGLNLRAEDMYGVALRKQTG